METIDILNRYRQTLASDHQGITILALMFKEGPQSEAALCARTDTSRQFLASKLRELFQAKLVRHGAEPTVWASTTFADDILTALGIAQTAAVDLLWAQPVPDRERAFLHACALTRDTRDASTTRRLALSLRAIAALESSKDPGTKPPRDDLGQLLYAVVIGSDTRAQQVGGAKFFESVVEWHHRNRTSLWADWGDEWRTHSYTLARSCVAGIATARESDRILLAFDENSKAPCRRGAARLTFVRLISSFAAGQPDPGVHAAFGSHEREPLRVCNLLNRTIPNAERRAEDLLFAWGALERPGPADRSFRVHGGPPLLVGTFAAGKTSLAHLLHSRSTLAVEHGKYALYENLLHALRSEIEAGVYDSQSERSATLTELLVDATSALRHRASQQRSDDPAAVRKPQA